jgi:hypothetical protein
MASRSMRDMGRMSHGHEVDDAPPDVAKGHETRDISTRVVVIFAIALIVGGVIVHGLIWLLYAQFARAAAIAYPQEYPMARVGAPQPPPEPRLQTRPREELQRMRAEEDRILGSYGWVDAQRGVVRIPIERAMEMVVDEGLPARAGAAPYAPASGPDKSNSGRTPPSAGR